MRAKVFAVIGAFACFVATGGALAQQTQAEKHERVLSRIASNNAPADAGRSGIPVVDVAAVCRDGVKADRASLTVQGQEMFDACTWLLAKLQ